MYVLISVTRGELEIYTSYHKTKKEAIDAMVEDMKTSCGFKSIDEIVDAADAGKCTFSDDGAWAQTLQYQAGTWLIEEIPEKSLNEKEQNNTETTTETLKKICECLSETKTKLNEYQQKIASKILNSEYTEPELENIVNTMANIKNMITEIKYMSSKYEENKEKPITDDTETIYSFTDDKEKMYDFFRMPKDAFLRSYSYLTEKEYDATTEEVNKMTPREIIKEFGYPVSPVDTGELLGQIIDIFEDFLEEKKIVIKNPERDEDLDLDPENLVNIYGSDYGQLQDEIHDTLAHWNILQQR